MLCNFIIELGIRSLADWRTTLHFLSRIEQRSNLHQTTSGVAPRLPPTI